MHAQGVDAERVRDHVQQLSSVPDAVGPSQPEGVVEVAVDAFGVVASPLEDFEVGVAGWDLADVLGPVELALRVLRVRVESDGDDPAAEAVGEAVGVVGDSPDSVPSHFMSETGLRAGPRL